MTVKNFLFLARFYLNRINRSIAVRNFIMWPVASRIFGKTYNDAVKLKNNLLMNVDLKDVLGRIVIFYGPYKEYFWEPATTKLTEKLIKDADNAIVAGAHIGYTILMARRAMAKKTAKLHAFEPVKYLFDISQKNILLNKGIGEIIISKIALNDNSGKVKIALDTLSSRIIAENDRNNAEETEIAESTTIDDYMQKQNINEMDFMLLDLEGNELNALKGAKNSMLKSPPKDIIFETNCVSEKDSERFSAISKLLRNYGYALYFIEDDYKFKDLKKNFDEIKLYAPDNAAGFSKKHCNALATKRSADELTRLGVKII